MLDVGDGQQVYWEVSGNPRRQARRVPARRPRWRHLPDAPAVLRSRRVPDRAVRPARLRPFRAARRGRCGSVREHHRSPAARHRTAAHPARNRPLAGLRGGSWGGSTLALAYAQRYPERVCELVLRGVFLLRRSEIDWYYNGGGAGRIYPDLWEKFCAPLAGAGPGEHPPVDTYHRLLHSPPDADVALKAAVAWSTWEGATSSLLPPRPDHVAETGGTAIRPGVRPDREPLLPPSRFPRRRPAAAGCAPAERNSRGHRAGPLRRGVPGDERVGTAPGVAGVNLAHRRRRRARRERARHHPSPRRGHRPVPVT